MLTHDVDLPPQTVQELAGRDALAAFFATLGYDTNARIPLTKTAIGVSEGLAANITTVERLAQQDGGLLEVYLFELKSLTTATIEALARFFRNRNADYLLVLTDDYQRIDFVLLQRYVETADAAGAAGAGLGGRAPGLRVRPRVLTVNRRDPDRRVLRVLRRFSYTESDPFAQWDKLLSAYDVAGWTEPYFNNRALFSDYYLNHRLPDSPEWDDKTAGGAMVGAFKALRARYADAREQLANAPAEITRKELLEPALQAMGFDPRPGQSSAGAADEPDYRLYSPGGAAGRPLAVCLAYCWARNLDGRDDTRDKDTPDEDPGQAAVALLARDEADWAIVTNGKLWRLYAAKAHSRATNYYEIDLEETLAWPEPDRERAFRYFWLLFRAAAFAPAARMVGTETQTLSFLDYLLGESERYARELEEELKERIFGEIFPHFARGFIEEARRSGGLPADLEDRPEEERNALLQPFLGGTLTFLYRLLFLLYAESRNLLPVQEQRGYQPRSLQTIKEEVAAQAGPIADQARGKLEAAYGGPSTALYDRLAELFAVVDRGNAALNVPVYNGGLFMTIPDPADHSAEAGAARFLAAHRIPDRYLALGLDRMARDVDPKRHDLVFIDYKSLGVRQLGSIYEGLLEFALRVAPEPMAVVKGKRTDEIMPLAEAQQKKLTILKDGRGKGAPDRVLPRGAVYLENNRRERKATGSYYTPDYIVKYIVRHTIGPVLDAKLEALRPAFRAAQQTLNAERAKAQALRGRGGDSPENQAYLKHRDAVVDAVFDLRVLDPAMGSGHFLVEAVDYITDRLAAFLSAFPWNPVRHGLGEIRREITAAMEEQGVSIDAGRLTDLNLLKRQVLKRCIYGVDLNPMAVELAKVSLWLDCFTLGAPLSFLDHHLKAGNSLIGGTVQEVQDALKSDLFGYQFAGLLSATQLMRRVGELTDATAAQVAESRATYHNAADALAPFKRLLDVWISEYFGNKGAQWKTSLYAGAIVANDYSKANAADKKAIDAALALAQDMRFFHWELEFPEAFYDKTERKDNAGFEVVVGNPPWALVSDNDLMNYAKTALPTIGGKHDTYRLFMDKAIWLLKPHGVNGFVVPSTFLSIPAAKKLREMLLKMKIRNIAKVEPGAFSEVAANIVVYVLENEGAENNVVRIENWLSQSVTSVPQASWRKGEAVFEIDVELVGEPIIGKVNLASIPLSEAFEYVLGMQLYHNTTHTREEMDMRIHHSQSPRVGFRRELGGSNIRRYETVYDKAQWVKVNPQKAYSVPHSRFFAGSRMLIREIPSVDHLIASRLDEEAYSNKSTLIVRSKPGSPYALDYCLSIINSKLLYFCFSRLASKSNQELFPRVSLTYLRHLPICCIHFTTAITHRQVMSEEAWRLYKGYCADNAPAPLLSFVEERFSKQPSEVDVVHDLLATLAAEMIRLNQDKHAAQQAFLDWLVATLQVQPAKDGQTGLDALTGKSRLADFPGDYQKGEPPLQPEELLDLLQKNKARLGVRLSTAGLPERITARYATALAAVLPLKAQLARTDALIDQIVYRLYGLTAAEIAVVEGG